MDLINVQTNKHKTHISYTCTCNLWAAALNLGNFKYKIKHFWEYCMATMQIHCPLRILVKNSLFWNKILTWPITCHGVNYISNIKFIYSSMAKINVEKWLFNFISPRTITLLTTIRLEYISNLFFNLQWLNYIPNIKSIFSSMKKKV